MRSSGSNCIVVNDVFVPDHRVMMVPPAIGGQYANEDVANEPTHRAAFVPVLALVLIGAQLGLGRAAFDFVVEKAAAKPIAYSFFPTQAESTAVHLEIAKAASCSIRPSCTPAAPHPTSTLRLPGGPTPTTSTAPACAPTPHSSPSR